MRGDGYRRYYRDERRDVPGPCQRTWHLPRPARARGRRRAAPAGGRRGGGATSPDNGVTGSGGGGFGGGRGGLAAAVAATPPARDSAPRPPGPNRAVRSPAGILRSRGPARTRRRSGCRSQVDGLQKGIKQQSGMDEEKTGVAAGGAVLNEQAQAGKQLGGQQQQCRPAAGRPADAAAPADDEGPTENRDGAVGFRGRQGGRRRLRGLHRRHKEGRDAGGDSGGGGQIEALGNRAFKPQELWGRTGRGVTKNTNAPDDATDMLLLPTDDKSGFGEKTAGAPATRQAAGGPTGTVQNTPPGGGAGVSSGGPRPKSVDDVQADPKSDPKPAEQTSNTPARCGRPPGHAPADRRRAAEQQMQRKIIRNGEMTFEVDCFDSSDVQIAKIVAEEKAASSRTTDSEKLPNGKVKGDDHRPRARRTTWTRWCSSSAGSATSRARRSPARTSPSSTPTSRASSRPPGRWRSGCSTSSRTARGRSRTCVEAEKQLGIWREKIEQIEGEIRYYDNLVSLSTLNDHAVRAQHPDADRRLPRPSRCRWASRRRTSRRRRADAIKAIDEAKGRIIESELKKLEAGQFAATIVAEVPPDASGPADRPAQAARQGRAAGDRRASETRRRHRRRSRRRVKVERARHAVPGLALQPREHRPAADDEPEPRRRGRGEGLPRDPRPGDRRRRAGRHLAAQPPQARPDDRHDHASRSRPTRPTCCWRRCAANGDVMRMEVDAEPRHAERHRGQARLRGADLLARDRRAAGDDVAAARRARRAGRVQQAAGSREGRRRADHHVAAQRAGPEQRQRPARLRRPARAVGHGRGGAAGGGAGRHAHRHPLARRREHGRQQGPPDRRRCSTRPSSSRARRSR